MTDLFIMFLAILIVIMLWIMLYDGNRFTVTRHTFSDRRIKKRFRAVVLADVHNKSYGKDNERLLAAIRGAEPDMILVAGDILTAKPGKSLERPLHLLRELAKDYPVYYGNGNHEHRIKLYPETYGSMADEYAKGLSEIGIEPLVNTRVILAEYGAAVYGLEIDKFYYKRFKIQKMEESYLAQTLGEPDRSVYGILLAHNPDYFPQYAEWGADLVLSGHVHGGVVRVPFWNKGVASPNIRLFPKYDGGRYDEGGSVMLVSRGLGEHTLPVRIFNPGDLLVVDFEPAEGTGCHEISRET